MQGLDQEMPGADWMGDKLAAAITDTDPEDSDTPFILIAVVMLSFIGFWLIVVCSLAQAVGRRLGFSVVDMVAPRRQPKPYGRLGGQGQRARSAEEIEVAAPMHNSAYGLEL